MLYQRMYSFAMSICIRYASNKEEALEILNDGFFKVFTKIEQFDEKKADFRSWLRSILVHQAIDYHRKYHKRIKLEIIDEYLPSHEESLSVDNDGLGNLLYEELVEFIQHLPPQYRMVFNLFVIEEMSHPEIAKQLGITVGTSKSNFSKARKKLMDILQKNHLIKKEGYGG
ncbi:MAG: sigma-70 family RNA polymerase sigma factor [Saprospiraceae bacterium]